MIIVIRITGQINLPEGVKEALHRLKIRKKYSAVLVKSTKENMQLMKKLRNFVAYGTISAESLSELLAKRGKPLKVGQKLDSEKIISGIEKKPLEDFGLKPFFRLHSPRRGIDAKKHFGVNKGVLGDNGEKINDLVRRML